MWLYRSQWYQDVSEKSGFTFIDLFAGIGGIRLGFEEAGGRCLFSSEYDRFAQFTYQTFFGERPDFSAVKEVNPPGDITKLRPDEVPNHDILTAGFPCQPFSLAGVSKKQSLGRPHGFDDPTQGTLFFNVKEILHTKRPKAFLLENVKNLLSHDKGRTYRVIREELDAHYHVFARVIDAAGWVPQHRERIYITGFRKKDFAEGQDWEINEFPELTDISPTESGPTLDEILEPVVPDRYTLGPGTWQTLLRHRRHHRECGNGFGYGLIQAPFYGKITRTLSARYHKDGAEVLIEQDSRRPRRLTPLECARLFGFPRRFQKYFARNGYEQPVSDTQAYRQFGNSVVVPVVSAVAKTMAEKLRSAGAI